jgi:hypothetical protein
MTRRLAAALLLAVALLGLAGPVHAASGTMAPLKPQFFDDNGAPLDGGKLFIYSAGTTTKATTYTDSGLTSANTNPIVLDSAGRCTIFLAFGTAYKFVLAPSTDTDPPTSPLWTVDGILSSPTSAASTDVVGTAGESLTAGQLVYLSSGSGSKTAGRWYRADAANTYSSTGAWAVGFAIANITSATTGTIRLTGQMTGLAGLTPGSAYYASAATPGAITPTAPDFSAPVGIADSASTLLLTQWVPSADLHNNLQAMDAQAFGGNLIRDNVFEIWAAGSSATPTHWQSSGAGVALAKVSGRIGPWAAKLTSGGGAAGSLFQIVIPTASYGTYWQGQTFSVSVWGRGSAAGAWRVAIGDGVTASYSAFNTVLTEERLGVTLTTDASASTDLYVTVEAAAGGQNVSIDGIVLVRGSIQPMRWSPSRVRREWKTFTVAGAQTTGTTKGGWTLSTPYPIIVKEVRGNLGTAATGATLFAVDFNKNGTTMLGGTKLTFTASATTANNKAPDSATYSAYCLTRDDAITFDIDAVGSTIAGSDLTVGVVYESFPSPLDEWLGITDIN